MAKRIRLEDIERLLGPCGTDGIYFKANFPDGVDFSTAGGRTAIRSLFDRGLKVEFGLAVVLDQDQRKRFIQWTAEERMALLGNMTQEEVAQSMLSDNVLRRETAIGIMVDLGTEGRPRDLVMALAATEKALLAFGQNIQAMRDRAFAWFTSEATAAISEGRIL